MFYLFTFFPNLSCNWNSRMCRAVKCAEAIGELWRKLKKFLREEETTTKTYLSYILLELRRLQSHLLVIRSRNFLLYTDASESFICKRYFNQNLFPSMFCLQSQINNLSRNYLYIHSSKWTDFILDKSVFLVLTNIQLILDDS